MPCSPDIVRVLVLDDDSDHMEAMRRIFVPFSSQFALETVETVRQAKNSIRKRTPDLALIDWRLSDGSGTELLPGYGRPAAFPVILMTSYGNEEVEADVLSKGAVDYVVKNPTELRRLPELCSHVLRFWRHLLRERDVSNTAVARAYRLSDLGMVAGGMVHDLNNKLAAIKRAVELATEDIREEKITEKTIILLGTARESAFKSQTLTRHLLDNAIRVHQNQVKVIDLATTMESIARTLRAVISGSIDIEFKMGSITDRNVCVDPLELELVITNLVKNAEEAIGNKAGKITLLLEEVEIATPRDQPELEPGHYLRLQIQDNGQGIAQEHLKHLFEHFFTTKQHGTGLGLARAKICLEQCKGAITVRSQWGEGTTFSLYFPVSSISTPEVSAQTDLAIALRGNGERIIVVDDEESLLPGLAMRLERWNYRVKVFNDSEKAFRYLLDSASEVDLVVTDYLMPGMTGTELRRALRERLKRMPRMILMTGRQDKMNASKAKREGFDEFVEKQRDDLELSRKIRGRSYPLQDPLMRL
jgi:two-component system cell cycle sensor histidine kinase/response regulator CckA